MRKHTSRSAEAADHVLGEAIRRRREALRMTQQQLAEACSVSYQQMQKYESGLNRISFSRLVKIGRALGSTVAELTSVLDQETSSAYIEHERFRDLPDAEALLRRYAQLTPVGRAALLQLLGSAAAPAADGHPRARPPVRAIEALVD